MGSFHENANVLSGLYAMCKLVCISYEETINYCRSQGAHYKRLASSSFIVNNCDSLVGLTGLVEFILVSF